MSGGDLEPPAAIRAEGLVKRFGALIALGGLDLVVPPGESIAILGPNGAGKSTLLRLLATLQRPSGGRLTLFGGEVRGSEPELRRRVGFLAHQTLLYDQLTGRENLHFYARLYGLRDPRGAVSASLAGVRLEDRQDDPVATYSRGMQQRLAIARALLHGPDLVLLDEPFTGLDRDSRRGLYERLERERRDGRTLLFATHDLEPALRLAGRILVLRRGRLELDRPATRLDPAGLARLLEETATGARCDTA